MLKEYVSHSMIGTPLEIAALQLRRLIIAWNQFKNPEIREIFLESTRMKQVIDRAVNDSTNCIDVGCHLGSMLKNIQRRSPKGQHIGIEPVPYKAAWLKQKFPNLEILQIAVTDQEGEAEFFVRPSSSAYSGLRLQGAGSEEFTTIKVTCKRLDDIVPVDRTIGFIKLDAEGGELAVLRGGEALIKRCHPIIMFTSTLSALESFQIDPKDVYDTFTNQYNYSLYTMKGWLNHEPPLTVQQFINAMHYPFQAFRFVAAPKQSA